MENPQQNIGRILVCVLLFAGLAAGCATTGEKAKQMAEFHHQLARSSLLADPPDYTEALRNLLQAEANAPADPEIQHDLGLAYYAKGKVQEAIKHYEKAIELRPDFSRAYNNIGVVYLASGQYSTATKYFEKALENILYTNPENAYLNLGIVQMKMANDAKALEYFQRASQASLRFCGPYLYSARILLRMEKFNDGVANIEQAVKACPDDGKADAYLTGGKLWLKKKNKKLAAEHFDQVCKLAPETDLCEESKRYLQLLKK